MNLPSDYKILECIFQKYKDEFWREDFQQTRSAKYFVPIDCKLIAATLKTDPDMVFGRLHYHLEQKYGYENSDGTKVQLFALQILYSRNCINVTLLTSVLAGLREERKRQFLTQAIALTALIFSAMSIIISLMRGLVIP